MALAESRGPYVIPLAIAGKVWSADTIKQHPDKVVTQPWERCHNALHHFIECMEKDFLPICPELRLNLDAVYLFVGQCTYDSGDGCWFEPDAPEVSFSWSQMPVASDTKFL